MSFLRGHGEPSRTMMFLLFLILPVTLQAGTLTQKVQETYQSTRSFEAQFTQKTHIQILDRDVVEKGRLIFDQPGKFFIHYFHNQGSQERQYLCDGKNLVIYRPRDKEVERYQNIHDQISPEALIFLGGLGNMTREFRVSEKGETLTLTPKKKSSLMKQIVLTIDPKTSLVSHVLLLPKSGNQSLYEFSNTKTNQSYNDKIFLVP